MTETESNGREKKPEPRKIPIRERLTTPELQEKFSDLEFYAKVVEDQLYAAYGSAPTKEQMHEASQQGKIKQNLITIAKDARRFAVQYRNFNVGAAALGLRKTEHPGQNPWKVLFDANTKPSHSDAKYCAEQFIMDRAESEEEQLEKVLAFVVFGSPQTDNDSMVRQITLTPCKLCRDRMEHACEAENPIVTPDTEIITASEFVTENGQVVILDKTMPLSRLKVFHGELPEGYRELG